MLSPPRITFNIRWLLSFLCLLICALGPVKSFAPSTRKAVTPPCHSKEQPRFCTTRTLTALQASKDDDKFGFTQRIDSAKSLVVGALVGSFAVAIPEALHQLVLRPLWNLPGEAGLAQFEFDNDTAALLTGLFAIVYRYGLRQDTTNPQLNQGLIGAFVLTRTFSRVTLPSYCTAITLNCGPPLGYLDWNVLLQLAVNGAESAVMYAATAWAMDVCMERGWISRFPG